MKAFFLILITAATSFSCAKENDTPNPEFENRPELLSGSTEKEWLFHQFFVENQDLTSSLENCKRDDLYRFFASKNYEKDEGVSRCTISSPQIIESGTWYFNSAKTTLTFERSQNSFTVDIVSLTENELRVSQLVNGARHVLVYLWG